MTPEERWEAKRHRDVLLETLADRIRQLCLLHAAAQLLRDRPFDRTALEKLVLLLPQAWMFQECCEAHIAYIDIDVSTRNWRPSPWQQSAPFVTSAGKGVIEVAYLRERPAADEGPFFVEERALLDSLAEMLSASLERDDADRHRRKLEEQIPHSQELEALGTLTGGIAHEFNNLLAVIGINAEIGLQEVPRGNPAQASLEEIRRASVRGRELVKQMLVFSRRQRSERKPLQLPPVVEEALGFLRATLRPDIELRASYQPALAPVSADATQIYQVILSLCSNAAHAMRATGGLLSVSVECVSVDGSASAPFLLDLQPGSYVRIAVRDTGTGMSHETLEHLFEPFFTTRGHTGSGLGLSVVHGIVKDHGGAIAVETTLGTGKTFHVYLPSVPAPAVRPVTATAGPIRGQGQRVMYVDDEEDLVFVTQHILNRLGYRCTAYSDAETAMQAFRVDPDGFDAVVTDVAMPSMSGLELAHALWSIRPKLRIAVTSGSWGEDADAAKIAGIATRIQKPASIDELSRALHTLLRDN